MEVAGCLPNDGESDKAAKFYEQALLLVDCCKIPEAIKLLEKAIELNPDSEVYKETLAFFQMNAECYADHLAKHKQGLSYASVTRAKSNAGNEKEKSSPEWNVKKTRLKENPSAKMPWSPAVSSSYYSDPYEQATIENPWSSFVSSSYRSKKTDSSPIDGLSEIELPSVNEYKMESPYSKEDYKQQVEEHTDSSFSSMLKTPISSQETVGEDGSSFGGEHENDADISADHFGYKNGVYPEGSNRYNDSHDENMEARFLEELCTARETAIDDWAKYYDLLRSGLKEGVSSTQADSLGQNVSPTQNSDSLDESPCVRNRKCQPSSDKPASKSNNKVCSKCGHFSGSSNLPPSPTKNRIHFVNGACVSSSNYSYCTCNKQNKVNSERQSPRSHLSLSQQEFYRNLQSYFGNGKVKSRKTTMDEGKDRSSDNVDLHSTTRRNSHGTNISSNATKEPPIATSNQNVMESVEDDAVQSENRTSKEHESHEVKNEASSFAEGVKKDKKSLGEVRFQRGFKSKSKIDEKVKGRPRVSKTEHAKNSKEGSSGIESQRQARPKVGVKSRVSHKVKAEDTIRTVPATDVKERPSRYRTEEITHSQADINLTKFFYGLYCTGISLLSKSGQAFKSIMYYLFLLFVLLFGFVIYCVWFACRWLCRKVLHFIPADRWLALVRNKGSALYEWCKKYRERRKMSGQGQTYDLPKNGDAAVIHMLQNKDSDPYSVLGVPRDATDDDLRKQYRKLAVLIHPDKNTHPQADEAFKTLANAFDVLSDPVKRSNFDAEEAWKRRAEDREAHFGPTTPEQFFADLGRKMQEMQNFLHCNACDGKHRRYTTDRFVLTARYCSRCSTRHAAKEGDLWAESSFLGYKLHFYACMEGEVYDVTEWAACQGIGSYRVEPNPHTVHLKLKTRQTHPSGFNSRSEEKDFENFMRQFFGQFPSERERYHGTSKPQKRRRKKKH